MNETWNEQSSVPNEPQSNEQAQAMNGQMPYGQQQMMNGQMPYGQKPMMNEQALYGQQQMMNRQQPMMSGPGTKYCQTCGAVIPAAAVVCTNCGCQVGQMKAETPNIVINNTNTNANVNTNVIGARYGGHPKNKWVSFVLCLCLGWLGGHKFYEGKAVMGIIYLFTFGLFGFGWLIDCILLLLKPNPYYV